MPAPAVRVMTLEEIGKKYRLTADYHTHTYYSVVGPYKHGKGSIMENVEWAHNEGLTELAITDHGPREIYGLDPKKLPKMRAEIAQAMERFPDVKVYLGVEANVMDSPNGLDVAAERIADYDFVNAGYHYGVPKAHMVSNWISFNLPCPQWFKDKVSKKNTELALRALHNNKIKIFTHPGDKAYFDLDAIAAACEETGTWVEINARHKRPNAEDIQLMAKYDVKFVINSDAHTPGKVGRYVRSVALAMAGGVLDRVVNVQPRQT